MIIVVGGIKGDSCKTTIATNLTIMMANQGCNVLLVDADARESAYDFTALRAENDQMAQGIPALNLLALLFVLKFS